MTNTAEEKTLNWLRMELEMRSPYFRVTVQSDPEKALLAALTAWSVSDTAFACRFFPEIGFKQMSARILESGGPEDLAELARCPQADVSEIQPLLMARVMAEKQELRQWSPLVDFAKREGADVGPIAAMVAFHAPSHHVTNMIISLPREKLDPLWLFVPLFKRNQPETVRAVLECPGLQGRREELSHAAGAAAVHAPTMEAVGLVALSARPHLDSFLAAVTRHGRKSVESFIQRMGSTHAGLGPFHGWLAAHDVLNS